MLYQLSYALRPHYQVSTFGSGNSPARTRSQAQKNSFFAVAESLTLINVEKSRSPSFYAVIPHLLRSVTLKSHNGFIDLR